MSHAGAGSSRSVPNRNEARSALPRSTFKEVPNACICIQPPQEAVAGQPLPLSVVGLVNLNEIEHAQGLASKLEAKAMARVRVGASLRDEELQGGSSDKCFVHVVRPPGTDITSVYFLFNDLVPASPSTDYCIRIKFRVKDSGMDWSSQGVKGASSHYMVIKQSGPVSQYVRCKSPAIFDALSRLVSAHVVSFPTAPEEAWHVWNFQRPRYIEGADLPEVV